MLKIIIKNYIILIYFKIKNIFKKQPTQKCPSLLCNSKLLMPPFIVFLFPCSSHHINLLPLFRFDRVTVVIPSS